ncbi:MAG: hypothetical protein R3Y50_06180 [Rikenellaceae bacterium]
MKAKLFKIVTALLFNAAMGSIMAFTIGVNPFWGIGVAWVVSTVLPLLGAKFIPEGVLQAGVLTEVWTGEMIKAFRTSKESVGWYDRIRNYDQYVENDVIHFTKIGGDPTVLVNNTTYPLNIVSLDDADKPVSLDYYDSQATPVTDDELYAISYDKMESVKERHKYAIEEKIYEKAIHAIAPTAHDAETPVLLTTGADTSDGTRKMFTSADLLTAKRTCDSMGMPKSDRIMVLCGDHINDLLETEQKFKDHYNINQTDGKIARLYGFDIYEYDGTPYFNVTTKKKLAFGAATTASTDRQSSVFYYNGRIMKANGSVQFYYAEAKSDPLYHRNLINYRKWNICLPLKEDNSIGVIISDIPESDE